MAQFLTDKYLKYRSALLGRPINNDKPCERCGYNLRGLRYGGACPECGTPIMLRRDGDLAFHEMPLPLIRSFRFSSWMATAAIGGVLVVPFAGYVLAGSLVEHAVAITGLTVLWCAAVWRLTAPLDVPQAIAHGFAAQSRLRQAARWSQGGWALVAMAPWLTGASPSVFLAVALAGALIGVTGLIALALFLGRLADWVRDDFAAKAFNLAVFGTPIGAMLLLLVPVVLAIPLGGFKIIIVPLVAVPIIMLFVASILAFPLGLLSLSRAVDWSVIHAKERMDRSRKLHDRMAPRPAPRPAPPDPIELAEPRADRPPVRGLSSAGAGSKEDDT